MLSTSTHSGDSGYITGSPPPSSLATDAVLAALEAKLATAEQRREAFEALAAEKLSTMDVEVDELRNELKVLKSKRAAQGGTRSIFADRKCMSAISGLMASKHAYISAPSKPIEGKALAPPSPTKGSTSPGFSAAGSKARTAAAGKQLASNDSAFVTAAGRAPHPTNGHDKIAPHKRILAQANTSAFSAAAKPLLPSKAGYDKLAPHQRILAQASASASVANTEHAPHMTGSHDKLAPHKRILARANANGLARSDGSKKLAIEKPSTEEVKSNMSASSGTESSATKKQDSIKLENNPTTVTGSACKPNQMDPSPVKIQNRLSAKPGQPKQHEMIQSKAATNDKLDFFRTNPVNSRKADAFVTSEDMKARLRSRFNASKEMQDGMKDTGIETFDTLPVDKWQPLAVRRLPRPPMSQLKNIPLPFETKTFSLDFLQYFFGGFQHTPGMYYIPKKEGHSILPSRSYYLMDSIHEPYLPKGPGEHGAKLTAFFNDNATDFFEDGDRSPYEGVPLFICGSPYMKAQKNSERIQYIYCGHYTQNRWSDKLDYDRMMEQVPNEVREYHAEELCKLGRPGWVTYRLTEHFWPKPQYDGLLPLSIDLDTDKDRQDFLHDVGSYICELHHWQKGLEAKAVRLKKKSIMKAFEAPDAGNPKGLRLWWEYLKCDGWESTFYNLLVKVQERFYAKGLNKRYDDE